MVQTGINSFLLNNAAYYNLENLHFNFIHNDSINACPTKPPNNFIGFTKGLVDYSLFLFINICRDNKLLNKELGNSENNRIKVYNIQFKSWAQLIDDNPLIQELLNEPTSNSKRNTFATSLITYYSRLILLHEIGHLKQRNRTSMFEFGSRIDVEKNMNVNVKNQVYEMDADIFAVNGLAELLIKRFNETKPVIDDEYFWFFENKKIIVVSSLLMLFIMFFVFTHNINFKKYILEEDHPHPSLRLYYSIQILFKSFVENNFLEVDEMNVLLKEVSVIVKISLSKTFPDVDTNQYFLLINDMGLHEHYDFLQCTAKSMRDLNGFGQY